MVPPAAPLFKLDPTNLQILELLQHDGRRTIADLARRLGLGESTVRERIARLESLGILAGYRAMVDPARIGLEAHAIVRAGVDSAALASVSDALRGIPHVVRAFMTTGPKPLVIEVRAPSLADVQRVVDEKIAFLPIHQPEISIVMGSLVDERPGPVSAKVLPKADVVAAPGHRASNEPARTAQTRYEPGAGPLGIAHAPPLL